MRDKILMMPILLFFLIAFDLSSAPLKPHPENPRYFTDGSGKAIYLTGSHTWSNFKDMGPKDPPELFDFKRYLDFLEKNNHNFVRLWTWELFKYSVDGKISYALQFPWQRTGPGSATDGKPRFDLTKPDWSYYERLKHRVEECEKRRIYVSVMLFEGWGLFHCDAPWKWEGHPFNIKNNINGINGDPDGDGSGIEYQTLKIPEIVAIQEAYVSNVVRTLNSFDNVLYEISNEAGTYSTEWQYHMINFVKDLERKMPKQHPVGMTFQYSRDKRYQGKNSILFESPADWISPNPDGGYRDDPPPADGKKVVLNDTDHLWGIGGNVAWVWKSFCRGYNPIFMDPYLKPIPSENKRGPSWTDYLDSKLEIDPKWDSIRKAMGVTLKVARTVDLAKMILQPQVASSRYCLANPGKEYIVYTPVKGELVIDLTKTDGEFAVKWIHPIEGTVEEGDIIRGGDERKLIHPFSNDAVLYLIRK